METRNDDLPDTIGACRLVSVLGEGGFGIVYLVEHSEPVRRRVAVRVLKAGMDTREVIARLETFIEIRSRRLIRSARLYFSDSGLALHLCGVDTATELTTLPNADVWLENVLLNDSLVWRETGLRKPGVLYRRTIASNEVDFIIESGRCLLSIEPKASSTARVAHARRLDAFCREFPGHSPFGGLLDDGKAAFALTASTLALPLITML